MTSKTPPPAPGDVLGERYTLKRNEWVGPLGPVWLARDRVLDRAVLVQLLHPALAADQTTRRAFQKAAARTAQIGGPGLLQVFDIGDQPAFAVLEHASGGRLIDRLNAGPMRTTDAARALFSSLVDANTLPASDAASIATRSAVTFATMIAPVSKDARATIASMRMSLKIQPRTMPPRALLTSPPLS